MELHQLRYFCAVARTGSFTRAAAEEGVAQPSLSQQIVKLELTLGAKLFDRLSRSVQLTEYGRTLLPQALAILREVNEARSTLESLRRGVAGNLSVGCIPTITPYFLAPRLSGFAERFPDVELRLMEETTPKLVELLQAGKLDLAVVGLPPIVGQGRVGNIRGHFGLVALKGATAIARDHGQVRGQRLRRRVAAVQAEDGVGDDSAGVVSRREDTQFRHLTGAAAAVSDREILGDGRRPAAGQEEDGVGGSRREHPQFRHFTGAAAAVSDREILGDGRRPAVGKEEDDVERSRLGQVRQLLVTLPQSLRGTGGAGAHQAVQRAFHRGLEGG